MALFTILTKTATMRIVIAVASKAGCRCCHFYGVALRMAGVTLQSYVFAGELELGFAVVIETPERPAVRVVAALALCPYPAFVMRILMAGGTQLRRIVVGRRAVAFLTRYRGVQADQRKLCHVVIKDHFFPPAFLVVAGLATVAELALMRVV